MTVTVDSRGLSCPAPVIRTKEALEQAGSEDVIAIVDNEAAKENVRRLGEKLKYGISVRQVEGDFFITLSRNETCDTMLMALGDDLGDFVVMIASDKMGEGSPELGNVLMRSYFYALTETKPYPRTIIFVNSGVNLTVEDSPVLDKLTILRDRGVEILSCGTCLDFYNLKAKLVVGDISNMYSIVEKINEAAKVIRI